MSTAVSVLGGISIVISSYLARARGENKPEKSEVLVKGLDQFIREVQTFITDRGHLLPADDDEDGVDFMKGLLTVTWFRQRLEDLLTG